MHFSNVAVADIQPIFDDMFRRMPGQKGMSKSADQDDLFNHRAELAVL